MKVIFISGSRNPEGQTASAMSALLKGVEQSGGETASFYLPVMKFERCRQCENDGWGICRTEGRCVIQDDFASTVDEIKGADAVVFATPVYFGDISESLRALLERLRRTCMNDEGRSDIEGKVALGLCVAGGGGGGSYSCAECLEKILRTCGFDVFDVTPARRQNLEMKLPLIEGIGRWIVEK
ncbi:MAG TPA: flavodoxin family protein [Armatimonadota bacterium]